MRRLELRLRDAYPVLIFNVAHRKQFWRFAAQFFDAVIKQVFEVTVVGGEYRDDGTGPGLNFRFQPRFAVKRCFVGTVGIGIFKRGSKRSLLEEEIA